MQRHRAQHLWPKDIPVLAKPSWLRKKQEHPAIIEDLIRSLSQYSLNTVCQEASCPNMAECFSHKTATFMILGKNCTRRCSFCDVAHGKPTAVDPLEPERLAEVIIGLGLEYVVITSVDRDDLLDGGAQHFVDCMQAILAKKSDIKIEILVPDFRNRQDKALAIFQNISPYVFNHNIETVPSLYKAIRPGSDYQVSLDLLKKFKQSHQNVLTKSGMMLGLGETEDEILSVLKDLRAHEVDIVTLGQYLRPSAEHYPVMRYVHPDEFDYWAQIAKKIGFHDVASGPLVRSSYQADILATRKSLQ